MYNIISNLTYIIFYIFRILSEISGHPDIFFTKINDEIFKAKNVLLNHKEIMTLKEGEEEVGYEYPEDVKYNICQIGKIKLKGYI